MISKEYFVKTLNFLKNNDKLQEKFIGILEEMSPGSYCDCFLFSQFTDKIVDLLELIMDDTEHEISYFLFDAGWLTSNKNDILKKYQPKSIGDGYERILYKNPETLYDYLVKDKSIIAPETTDKTDYWLPLDASMYDMCYCVGEDCVTPCARKKTPEGICTVSDFRKSCYCYTKGEEK